MMVTTQSVKLRQFDPLGGREVHLTNSHVQTNSKEFQAEKTTSGLTRSFKNTSTSIIPVMVTLSLVSTQYPYIKKMSVLIIQSSKTMCLYVWLGNCNVHTCLEH